MKTLSICKNDNHLIWLKTSLFADRKKWAFILQNGIEAFIGQPFIKAVIEELAIEFNYVRGENIRFAIKIPTQNAETIACEIDQFFKSFFLIANLPNKNIALPPKGIFLPFPSNTIQYGLYDAMPDFDNGLKKIISKTSNCIINAFQDDETIILLSFYFHCALLTLANEARENGFIEDYMTKLQIDNRSVIIEKQLIVNEKSKRYLTRVEASITNYPNLDYSIPNWLREWILICKETLTERPAEISQLLIRIHNSINKQLGLTDDMIKLTHLCVDKCYNKILFDRVSNA